jgi:hypothetical protein
VLANAVAAHSIMQPSSRKTADEKVRSVLVIVPSVLVEVRFVLIEFVKVIGSSSQSSDWGCG